VFVLYGKEDRRLIDLEVSPLREYSLLLKVLTCGVCGSDATLYLASCPEA
jgi:threonine dehydrogenase-like Zn-dependent dehydrogenase